MASKRQTHLGFAGNKCLTIIDLPLLSTASRAGSSVGEHESTKPTSSTQRTLIFKLPDELLVAIVELAAGSNGPHPTHFTMTYDKVAIKILSRVCHRLHRLAQPLLYHHICFGWRNKFVPPSVAVRKLHRTLKERPDLRQHCR